MKVAIVHDWLVVYGGGERVLTQILKMFPGADLFALYDFIPPDKRSFLLNKPVKTSFLQKFPLAKRMYRNYLPLMPLAIEQFDLSSYDLVISNSHAVAKGVITGPDQVHISYVLSPIRYAWDLTHQYLDEAGLNRNLRGWLAKLILHYIRNWDVRTANNVDRFVCISNYISRRIKKVYARDATVIYPPVNVESCQLTHTKSNYYLTTSRMVPYKKIGLIVEAFSAMPDRKLIVIGDGPEFRKIKSKSADNITMMGYQSTPVLMQYMQNARAFVFAAEEDFGIVPVEAQACGTPVIAYGKGGALETIIENETGLFFYKQDIHSIIKAVNRFENMYHWDPHLLRENAIRFSTSRFRREFGALVSDAMTAHRKQVKTIPQDFPYFSGVNDSRRESTGSRAAALSEYKNQESVTAQ